MIPWLLKTEMERSRNNSEFPRKLGNDVQNFNLLLRHILDFKFRDYQEAIKTYISKGFYRKTLAGFFQ